MNTEQDTVMLTLAQWFSPAFPIGAFSYSHGLEWLVETGEIGDAMQLQAWLEHILQFGSGRNDLLLMSAAYHATTDQHLHDIDARSRAMASSRERLLEISDQGAAFVRTINDVWQTHLPLLTYPVAVGAAARALDLPLNATAQMYLHGLVSSLTSAAIRLVPIGQTEGQACIRAVTPLCQDLCASELDQPLDALGGSSFLADIASMNHEIQYSRMFRT